MKRYLFTAVAALAITLGIGGASSSEAASSSCPTVSTPPTATVFVSGSVRTAEAVTSPVGARLISTGAFYIFDVADSGHAETVLFGSSRDAQLRANFPASSFVSSCNRVGYSVYRINLGGSVFETVIVGSVREAQLRATGYIN